MITTAALTSIWLTLAGQATTDFAIFVQPEALAMSTGEVATAAVVTIRMGHFGVVALSPAVAPDGLGVSATLERATVGAGETAILTIQTLAGAAAGKYVITVTGVEGAIVHAATLDLTVTAPGQPGGGGCSTAGGGAGGVWLVVGVGVALLMRGRQALRTAAERRRAE